MQSLPTALNGLNNYSQFILYRLDQDGDRLIKKPIDYRTGNVINPLDSNAWTDFKTASDMRVLYGDKFGVGFVLTENDPFFLLDIDKCIDKISNSFYPDLQPLVLELLTAFKGAAVERSSSNTGLHVIGSLNKSFAHRSRSSITQHLELYTKLRFVALTGVNASGDVTFDCTHILPAIIEKYFPPAPETETSRAWTTEPRDNWSGPDDDDLLIERAVRSVSKLSAFNGRAAFADLWTADDSALADAYPSPTGGFDRSRADAALAQHLAYWTGCNCDRMQELMLESGLGRDKWTSRPQYLRDTILRACELQIDVLRDAVATPSVITDTLRPNLVTTNRFLTLEQQQQLFTGCAYVEDEHKILVPQGKLLKPEQFKVKFGGYSFSLDTANSKSTTDPWKAFIEAQGFEAPRVDSCCFRPSEPAGKIFSVDDVTYVNTYWPLNIKRAKGDATPFLNHLNLLYPHDTDALQLLSFFAACVQYPGVKFRWCPLIQGVEGNGKTLLAQFVIYATGKRYTHQPQANELLDRFNSWLYGKLLIVIEEIKVPEHQQEILELMKTRITSTDAEIQQKYADRKMRDICCNFILTSNYKDAIPMSEDKRRYAMFFSAQQSVADLKRDGLNDDYFFKFAHWRDHENGLAIVADFLHTFKIPDEYNPATKCQRAPKTSSTKDAIVQSRGSVAQEIVEAIEQGEIGFRGGWVSSVFLQVLLNKMKMTRSHSRRRELLEQLGYVPHPGLRDGRVNNLVLPDNGKPRLFIKKNHSSESLVDPALIAKAYEDAQNP